MQPDSANRATPRQVGTRAPLGRRLMKFGLALVTSALLLNALVGARGLPAVFQARRDYQQLAQQLHRVREQNEALRQEINRLRTEPGEIEAVARTELGLSKSDELVFVVHDATPGDATERPATSAPAPADAPSSR